MEDNVTLIATFYSPEPFLPAALKYSPRRIVLLIDSSDGKVKENINAIKKVFGKAMEFEVVKVPKDDILAIAKTTVELIDSNKAADNKIIVSVAGANKLLTNAVLFGSYARPDRILRIVTNKTQSNELISLPKLSYNIGSTKRDLLSKMEGRKDKTIGQIAKEMHRTRGMIYQHLKELKDGGYLDEDYTVTDAGRLALL